MKKCIKCGLSLFDKATNCGVCGNTDLTSVISTKIVEKEILPKED